MIKNLLLYFLDLCIEQSKLLSQFIYQVDLINYLKIKPIIELILIKNMFFKLF